MWTKKLADILARQPCVVVTLADIAGSAPRSVGARMLVTGTGFEGSIGGGNLEFRAIETARGLLSDSPSGSQTRELYGLGPELNQCCGGAVTLTYEVYRERPGWLDGFPAAERDDGTAVLVSAIDEPQVARWLVLPGAEPIAGLAAEIERFSAERHPSARVVRHGKDRFLLEIPRPASLPLYLFGAGHVGTALASVLTGLPFAVTWLDSRPGQFNGPGVVPHRQVECADPAARVAQCPPGSVYVVMTHSHQLDEDICFEVLQRGDAAWLGLIGSATKRRRFVHRLEGRGVAPAALTRLVCPVGAAGITGKRPATIAVAVAAQLLGEVVPEACR